MKSNDFVAAGLLDIALCVGPGAVLAQGGFVLGGIAVLACGTARLQLPKLRQFHEQYEGSSRYGLVLFVAWSIGGAIAAFGTPEKLLVAPPLLIFSLIYSAIRRPRFGSPRSAAESES